MGDDGRWDLSQLLKLRAKKVSVPIKPEVPETS